MNPSIVEFIEKQKSCTLCCVDEVGKPYCFSCFYIFNAEHGLLYFKSSAKSHHAGILANNPFVAGSILPDKLNVLLIKGIQFEGMVLPENHFLAEHASTFYYKKNPAAVTIGGSIWIVRIDNIKMTDSTLGFGKKITWNRNEKNTTVSVDS
ncbi:MAG: pyridoxamine 5'-phosphate oxidase family protein [Bacteroidota bacterium]|nr:pyridoxamine 5'-phosphate oxidase family protein [Bacteroidota bacterium]